MNEVKTTSWPFVGKKVDYIIERVSGRERNVIAIIQSLSTNVQRRPWKMSVISGDIHLLLISALLAQP